ncbi:ArsR family transcriptional regulator [Allopseudospirillum japonicum]|uniref:ArsR family transcriptional regulator n=1 Tax=Allopseudospirillum japonicum TaxID=64971 RepID=A0A1H6TV00_9GAMM|nr:metalloregulator ArsR/SmtB family transcription factor [Allopseudospirillum japonicum]SEI83888.1 ArsR family transcriptional regulator [Allopseudospirillum japonicum]
MSPTILLKALADDTRLRIVMLLLQEEELCVCELTQALDEIQPKISRHLALLRGNGLLVDRRQGQWVFYSLSPKLPQWIRQMLRELSAGTQDTLQECSARLQAMGTTRPTRCTS